MRTDPKVFSTREEVDAYFSGEKLECLICGKQYKNVGLHSAQTHHVSARDYKIRFGLPIERGLLGTVSRKIFSLQAYKLIDEGKLSIDAAVRDRVANPEKFLAAVRFGAKKPEFSQKVFRRNSAAASAARRIPPSTCEEFLRRIESGRYLEDVEQDIDMPSKGVIHAYAKVNKDFAVRLRKATLAGLVASIKQANTKITAELAWEFLRRRKLGYTVSEIEHQEGMVSRTPILRYMKIDREFAAAYKEFSRNRKQELAMQLSEAYASLKNARAVSRGEVTSL